MQHFKIIFIVTVSLLHITNSCMNEDNTKDNQIKNKSNEKKIKDLESVNKLASVVVGGAEMTV